MTCSARRGTARCGIDGVGRELEHTNCLTHLLKLLGLLFSLLFRCCPSLCSCRTLPNCGCGWSKIGKWHATAALIANMRHTAECSVLLGTSAASKLCCPRYKSRQKQKRSPTDSRQHTAYSIQSYTDSIQHTAYAYSIQPAHDTTDSFIYSYK